MQHAGRSKEKMAHRERARIVAYLHAHLVTPGYDTRLSPGDPGYRPHCLACPTMQRVEITESGFQCAYCGNETPPIAPREQAA